MDNMACRCSSPYLAFSSPQPRFGAGDRCRGSSVRDFYALRFARIAPLLLLLLAVLCALHAAGLKDFVVSDKTGGLGRALAAALTFHVNVLRGASRIPSRRIGISFGRYRWRKCFILFFPPLCWLLGRGKWLAGLSPDFRRARAVWPHHAQPWKRGLAGIFLPRWHGCHRSRLPDRHCEFTPRFRAE